MKRENRINEGMGKDKRKKKGCRRLCLIAALVLCAAAVSLSGCKKGSGDGGKQAGDEEVREDIIIRVGDKEVSRDEIMFYVLCIKQQYEGYFGSEIWSVDFGNGRTFEDMCKEDVMSEIVQLKVITSMAEAQNVTVTDDEADEIADTVREQMEEFTGQDTARYNITTELLERIYHDNYLSSKMFDVVTGEVDTNISDEEARNAKFQVLALVTDGEDKNGNEISMTKKEKAAALKKAKGLRKQADEGADFYSLATVHSDLSEVEMTIGKGVMGEAFDEVAFELKTGELSKVIEGETADYIVFCVNEMEEDATALAKESIITERQDKAFCALYEEWVKEFKVNVDEQKWAEIKFQDENRSGTVTARLE